jgi:hypothetical protein
MMEAMADPQFPEPTRATLVNPEGDVAVDILLVDFFKYNRFDDLLLNSNEKISNVKFELTWKIGRKRTDNNNFKAVNVVCRLVFLILDTQCHTNT